jgi:putative hydrolase of the HAD superfamily
MCGDASAMPDVASERCWRIPRSRGDVRLREMYALTIFLDLDGTLLDHDAAERSAAIEFFTAFQTHFRRWSAEEFADLWQAVAQKHIDVYLAGGLSFAGQRRERLREIFGRVDVAIDDRTADEFFQVYLGHYERSWKPFPDVLETLDRLKRHPLGIISNGDREQQFGKLESLGVRDRFAPVVISGEFGISKPAAGIFHEACRRANCLPHESVYVGDRLESDAIASRRAGLHGVWIDRTGAGLGVEDVGLISSLAELPGYVERIEKNLGNGALHRAETSGRAPSPKDTDAVWKEKHDGLHRD